MTTEARGSYVRKIRQARERYVSGGHRLMFTGSNAHVFGADLRQVHSVQSRVLTGWRDTHIKRDIVVPRVTSEYMDKLRAMPTFVEPEATLFDQCDGHLVNRRAAWSWGLLPKHGPSEYDPRARERDELELAVMAWQEARQLAYTEALLSYRV